MSLLYGTVMGIDVHEASQLFSEFLVIKEVVQSISICHEGGVFPGEYCVEGEELNF